MYLGQQTATELYGCDPSKLTSSLFSEKSMSDAAIKAGCTIVATKFHQFAPHGVSGVIVLAESHIAIHTWPEHGYVALDIFTCNEAVDHNVIIDHLFDNFKAADKTVTYLSRGNTNTLSTFKPKRSAA